MSRWFRPPAFGFFATERSDTIQKDTVLLNERIRAREVRTIADDGAQLGVLPFREALRIAQEKGLDLVMVAADATPPVCKIMDYGRHKFEMEKRTREARKKQHTVSLKEVTLSYKIGEHDYQVRLRAVRRFLLDADKVKVTIRFRGREMQHQSLGSAVLLRFAKDCTDIALVERDPRQEGRTLFLILSPKKSIIKAAADRLEKGDGEKAPAEGATPAEGPPPTEASVPTTAPAPASAAESTPKA